jgi:ribosomal protein L14
MEGEVVECVIREKKCRLRFRRDDGQMCVVRDDGALLSLGSKHPHTGDVMSAKVLKDYADTPYLQLFG